MPLVGFGTYKADLKQLNNNIRVAIKAGYRHFDTAELYENERELGEVFSQIFKEGVIKREELFITTKLWNNHHRFDDVIDAAKQSLAKLQLTYLDLYLIHWPIAFQAGSSLFPKDGQGHVILGKIPLYETWMAMEKLKKDGIVRSIGVSNYTGILLHDLLSYCTIPPVVNQIELHVYLQQRELVDFCTSRNVIVTAYSPLARHGLASSSGKCDSIADDAVIKEIATKHHKTPSQIVLRFSLQRRWDAAQKAWTTGNVSVIPKSNTPARIVENIGSTDFALDNEDIGRLQALNSNQRLNNSSAQWDVPLFYS